MKYFVMKLNAKVYFDMKHHIKWKIICHGKTFTKDKTFVLNGEWFIALESELILFLISHGSVLQSVIIKMLCY